MNVFTFKVEAWPTMPSRVAPVAKALLFVKVRVFDFPIAKKSLLFVTLAPTAAVLVRLLAIGFCSSVAPLPGRHVMAAEVTDVDFCSTI